MSLAEQARRLGFHVTLAAPAADRPEILDADLLIDGYQLGRLHEARRFCGGLDPGQGRRVPRCTRPVSTGAAYHAFVGSRAQDGGAARKADRRRASTPAPLDRIKAPGRPRPSAPSRPKKIAMSIPGRGSPRGARRPRPSAFRLPSPANQELHHADDDSQRIPASKEKIWACAQRS